MWNYIEHGDHIWRGIIIAIRTYFFEGYEYKVILAFLTTYHHIDKSLSSLKRRFKNRFSALSNFCLTLVLALSSLASLHLLLSPIDVKGHKYVLQCAFRCFPELIHFILIMDNSLVEGGG